MVFGHRLDHISLSCSKVDHSSDCMDSLGDVLTTTGAHSQGSTHMKWHRSSSQCFLLDTNGLCAQVYKSIANPAHTTEL